MNKSTPSGGHGAWVLDWPFPEDRGHTYSSHLCELIKCWVQEFSCTCSLILTRIILLLAPLYRWRNWGTEWLINCSTGTELGSCRDGMQKLSLTLNPLILPQQEDWVWRQKQMSLPPSPPAPVTFQLSTIPHQQGCPCDPCLSPPSPGTSRGELTTVAFDSFIQP